MTKIHLQPDFDSLLPLASARTLIALNNKLMGLETKFPGLLQVELLDFLQVFEMGAKKYAANNWLDKEGKTASHKEMHDCMFHHLSRSFSNTRKDEESNLDHLLHLSTRAIMMYIRLKRGIKHPND